MPTAITLEPIPTDDLCPSIHPVFSLNKRDLVGEALYTEQQWESLISELVENGNPILINTGETIFFEMKQASSTTYSTIGYELDAVFEDLEPPQMWN